MIGEKRARWIDDKARHQRELLAGVSSSAPVNVQIRLKIYSLLWFFKQSYYKNDNPLFSVDRRSYEADLERISYLERKIIVGGSDEERARKAVKEAREYLAIVAEPFIKSGRKCRVY